MENSYRILLSREKIEKIFSGQIPVPQTIDLELSNTCNQKCRWCFYEKYHTQSFLSVKKVIDIVDYARINHVKWIILSGGGEPTIHPYFLEIITRLKHAGINYAVITNGVFLNRFANQLVESCKYIRVSLDAANELTYGLLHGVPNGIFNIVIDNIKAIRAQKKTIAISLSYIVTKENVDELPNFIKLATSLDVNEILLKRDTRNNKTDNTDYLNIAIQKYDYIIRNSQMPIVYRKKRSAKKSSHHCICAQLKMVVMSDGSIPICCCKRDKNDIIGSIVKQSIYEIWGNETHKNQLSCIDTDRCPECRFSECNEIIQSLFYNDCIMDFV